MIIYILVDNESHIYGGFYENDTAEMERIKEQEKLEMSGSRLIIRIEMLTVKV